MFPQNPGPRNQPHSNYLLPIFPIAQQLSFSLVRANNKYPRDSTKKNSTCNKVKLTKGKNEIKRSCKKRKKDTCIIRVTERLREDLSDQIYKSENAKPMATRCETFVDIKLCEAVRFYENRTKVQSCSYHRSSHEHSISRAHSTVLSNNWCSCCLGPSLTFL